VSPNNHTDEPLIRVMALHALAYCERLFYLEEVEEIHIADARVFAGRTLHENLKLDEEESGEWSSLELSSHKLGLVGKVDCLRRRDGSIIPYEHKRGRPKRVDKTPAPWQSDALQVTAYAMLLEEETGEHIPEGRIHYHAENVTVRVPIDEAAHKSVLQAVARARELRKSTHRPPVTENENLCIRCSLAPVCLPEEERLAQNPQWEAVRLFPPDRETLCLHITEPGSYISRTADTLKIKTTDGQKRLFPMHDLGALIIHGYSQLTTQAMYACVSNNISVHWFSGGGRYVTSLATPSGGVQRRLRQYRALTNDELCLNLARRLAMTKVKGALRYILRSTRGNSERPGDIVNAIQTIRASLKDMAHTKDTNSLRGYEGISGRAYFSGLPCLLRGDIPDEMRFTKRSRRPPKDRFNALLGFGYALLYQAVLQAVLTVGLEPALGFYHTPRSSAYPLVLDMMELFRLPIWDIPLIGSINRLQWNPAEDFDIAAGRVWLSKPGKKKAISLFEKRLEDKWKHPVVGYSLSYARLIELETRLLEKEWSGQPGLFAKMRLR